MEEFKKIQTLIEEGNYSFTICLIDNSMINDMVYKQLIHCKKDNAYDNHIIFITSETPISSSLFLYEDEAIVDNYFIYPIDPNRLIDEIHSKMKNLTKKKKTNYNEFKVLSPLKVLVVEDIEINQEIMLYQLGQVGVQCEAVSNGHAAIEKIKQSTFDVILLDVRMPGIDGYETTRLIRALPKTQQWNIPIVAMTANVSMGEREKCLLAGMDDYLSKPIKADELYGTLLQFLPNEIILPQKENRYKINSKNPSKTPLKGIDIDTAFSLLDNDKELFTHLLNQFFEEYHDFTNLYNNTANDNNQRNRFVHSIKSISANLGATKLSHLAATLEKLVLEVPYEDYALAQHEFLNEFSLVIESIKHSEYFEKPKERKQMDSISLSIQEIISLLNMLKKRLHGGRNKEIKESMEMLLSISFEGLAKEKVATLQNFIRLYNHNKAILQVDEIIHLLSQQGR
jgi:CheY-like chemotaxis protein